MRLFPNSKRVKTQLLKEFKGKRILDLSWQPQSKYSVKAMDASLPLKETGHDLTQFPWYIPDNSFDLVVCQHFLEHLPDTAKALEEINRITSHKGKVFIETPHYTWFEAYRHHHQCHQFSFSSFDAFLKDNQYYKTDFVAVNKYIFFDDLTFLLGIGFLANLFPRVYEKRLAFIFPATSFHVTFQVEKSINL